jgi:hypothetical protein
MDMSEVKSSIQKYIDILVVLDFVVSMIGGIMKSSNEQVANYCFTIGGGFLFLAVIGIIYKNISR